MARIIVEGKRYDTAKLVTIWEGREEIGTGIYRIGVWMTPIHKHVIVGTDSIWEDRYTHGCVGSSYHIADENEVANLARLLDDDRLAALVPEGD